MARAKACRTLKALSASLLLGAAGQAWAEAGLVTAKVNSVLINADDTWGGCMAYLSVSPSTVLPRCAEGWVTFGCSGQFADPVRGYRMLDVAELALATGRSVNVWVRDDMMHDGSCFAHRIEILRQ